MISMGRQRTRFLDLPPHLQRKGAAYYYVKARKWLPLGSDRRAALREWAKLEGEAIPEGVGTFTEAAARWRREILPQKARKTQIEYDRQLGALVLVFGECRLDDITPQHIADYMARRAAKIAATREKALFSTVFNHARAWGMTAAPNPCAGVRGADSRRDRYVSDAEYRAVYAAADPLLRDAMDLAYYTGQRVGDVLRWTRQSLQEGALWVRQGKTKAALRIAIAGPLEAVIDRILARNPPTMRLVPLSYWQVRDRFDTARLAAGVDFQFRDLRAKAATDLEDTELAKRLLGHRSITTTERYTRNRAGEKVSPIKRKL